MRYVPLFTSCAMSPFSPPVPLFTSPFRLPLSQREGRPSRRPPPQDAGALAPTTLLRPAALVPTAAVRAQRRRQLRLARDGSLRVPAARPADPGQQVLPECRAVRAS